VPSLLFCGAVFWLADDFIAERTAITRDFERFAPRALPDPDESREKRLWEREAYARTARITGKALVALGGLLGVAALVRFLF
jgi:hypothetical protein